MSVKLHSAELVGIDGAVIDVEIDLAPGLYKFSIVGLADKAVDESKERIAAAIKNMGARSPQKKNQRVTVSLAPADLKKEGPAFDLPIALAYLLASRQARFKPHKRLFLGELALDGMLRPVKGVLALALAAREHGFKELFLPTGNGREASLAQGIAIFEAHTLKDVLLHLEGKEKLAPTPAIAPEHEDPHYRFDFADVKGQEAAKRGLEIAAAGNHNVLLSGPPGTGKTLLSRALPSIMPSPTREEIIEITKIHSAAGLLGNNALQMERPFRSPHHTSSHIALVGGGTYPRPGEITLAHRGVLFLDEFAEFERRVIEALRQPLEDNVISVSRAKGSLTFPAHILLVAAMNPCPCGNAGHPKKECICTPSALGRYERRVSGPIMDRLDISLEVPPVEHAKLASGAPGEPSHTVRKRVEKARSMQRERFKKTPILTNSEMGTREIKTFCSLDEPVERALEHAARSLDLSARAYHRVIKIARTIADLAGAPSIEEGHVFEAIRYRPKKKDI